MPTSDEINQEIKTLDARMNALAAELDEALVAARTDLSQQAGPWMKDQLNRAITEHAGVVEKMTMDQLRLLKQKVNDLIGRIPALVESKTAEKKDWPHRTTSAKAGSKYEGYFATAYREVISELGSVLAEFNIAGKRGEQYPLWQQVGNRYRYTINSGFEERQLPHVSRYNTLFADYRRTYELRAQKMGAYTQAKAREMFDSA